MENSNSRQGTLCRELCHSYRVTYNRLVAQDIRGVRTVNTAVAENLQSRFHKMLPLLRKKVYIVLG